MIAHILLSSAATELQRTWEDYVELVDAAIVDARDGGASDVVDRILRNELYYAAMAAPEKLLAIADRVGPLLDAAIREENAEWTDTLPVGVIPLMSAANALECVGGRLSSESRATLVAWIPRLGTKRNDYRASWYWATAFMALALAERRIYRPFTGFDAEDSLSFTPGQTFGFNIQGLVGHLAGAIEARAPVDAVFPAFDELIANYKSHSQSASVNREGIIWLARVVFERIGGAPTSAVAGQLRDRLAELAGAS